MSQRYASFSHFGIQIPLQFGVSPFDQSNLYGHEELLCGLISGQSWMIGERFSAGVGMKKIFLQKHYWLVQ